MDDVKSELASLKQISDFSGEESEYFMFIRFRELMSDKRFLRLITEYSGTNSKILRFK